MSEEDRLRKRLKKLEKVKAKLDKLRDLNTYTDKEKCVKFNEFHEFAVKIITAKYKGEPIKDDAHWCLEMVLKLLGEDVWEVYDNIGRK